MLPRWQSGKDGCVSLSLLLRLRPGDWSLLPTAWVLVPGTLEAAAHHLLAYLRDWRAERGSGQPGIRPDDNVSV